MTTLIRTRRIVRPTRAPKGHWRNKWRRKIPIEDVARFTAAGAIVLDAYTYLGTGRWPSAEIAEQKAIESLGGSDDHDYLGPVFMPDSG